MSDSEVRFRDSLRYAGKLFGFFAGIVIVAGAAIGVGVWLAEPGVRALLNDNNPETARLAGGIVAGLVGLAVFSLGTFTLRYKLVADAVLTGTEPVAERVSDLEAAIGQDSDDAASTKSEPATPSVTMSSAGTSRSTATDRGATQSEESTTDTASTRGTSDDRTTTSSASTRETAGDESTTQRDQSTPSTAGSHETTGTTPDTTGEGGDDTETNESSREQTATEIAFGDEDTPEESEPDDESTASGTDNGSTDGPPDDPLAD